MWMGLPDGVGRRPDRGPQGAGRQGPSQDRKARAGAVPQRAYPDPPCRHPRKGRRMTPDPLFDFTGKVALVTGGSRGLGYRMVKALAERGADVIVASRKLDKCEEVAGECRALGRRALAHGVHCGRWDEIDGDRKSTRLNSSH